MLHFDDDYENDSVPIHKGSLSSIFERNRRNATKKLLPRTSVSFLTLSSLSSSAPVPAVSPANVVVATPLVKEQEETNEENLQFNSKLTWLKSTPSITEKTSDSLSSEFLTDFPDLSRSVLLVHGKKKSEKDYNTLCPKIKDGYHCTKEEKEKKCAYQHPEKKEVEEIVSTMRSLKKRVVKDVLKIINEDTAGEKKKMTPTKSSGNNNKSKTRKPQHQQSQDKTKFCKFLTDCKYKSKCNYAHTKEELKINDCQFGGRCKMATKKSDGSGEYEGKCSFIHPLETRDMYFIRHK